MDLGLFTVDEVVRLIFEKVTPKYNIPSSFQALYDVSFLCVQEIPAADETKTLKLVAAGSHFFLFVLFVCFVLFCLFCFVLFVLILLFSSSPPSHGSGIYYSDKFDRLQCNSALNADRIVWQVSEPFLKVLKELSADGILKWLNGAYSHHYWPKLLGLEMEWLPNNRGCWLHCKVYNPNDDHYTCIFAKAMVVGIEPHEELRWTKQYHRFFPAPVRDAVFTLLMLHRRGPTESLFGKLG